MGLVVILALVGVAIYAMVTIPYQEAIRLWRGGEDVWYRNPKFAAPAWINLFSSKKYAESFAVMTADGSMPKEVTSNDQNTSTTDASYTFSFKADTLPQDMILYITSTYQEKQPFLSAEWHTPDGRTIRLTNMVINKKQTYRFAQDEKLKTKLKTDDVIAALFTDPGTGQIIKEITSSNSWAQRLSLSQASIWNLSSSDRCTVLPGPTRRAAISCSLFCGERRWPWRLG